MREITGKRVSTMSEALSEVEDQLSKFDELPLHSIGTINQKLRDDAVLPMLDLTGAYAAVKRNDKGDIIIVIGPRDWQFSPMGQLIGAGTCIE